MLSVNTFFTYFIYNPSSEYLTPKEQKIASIASRALSFLSLTLLPRACKFFWAKKASLLLESPESIKVLTERIQSIIRSSPSTETISKKDKEADKRISCHQIINGLFLGNSEAFVDTTCLSFADSDASGKRITKQTFNPLKIENIITLCPLNAIVGDFSGLSDLIETGSSVIQTSLKERNITWLNPGKTAVDSPEGWLPIAHDCTFPDSIEASKELDLKKGMIEADFANLQQAKIQKMSQTDVKEWFEPVFKCLDQAVFYHKQTLIHCQAGASRSASVLAAYLINRFNVTHQEALNYLSSKRRCVGPKFLDQLKEYQQALSAARAR